MTNKREGLYGVGQVSEQLAARYLSNRGWFVIPISEFTNNTGGRINAPMVVMPSGLCVGPDLFIIKAGSSMWVEVKQKDEPTYFWKKGEWQHGVDLPEIMAYKKVSEETKLPCHILVHEIMSPKTPDLFLMSKNDITCYKRMKEDLIKIERWLSINLADAIRNGEVRPGNPNMISTRNPEGNGLYWPRSAMREIFWETEGSA